MSMKGKEEQIEHIIIDTAQEWAGDLSLCGKNKGREHIFVSCVSAIEKGYTTERTAPPRARDLQTYQHRAVSRFITLKRLNLHIVWRGNKILSMYYGCNSRIMDATDVPIYTFKIHRKMTMHLSKTSVKKADGYSMLQIPRSLKLIQPTDNFIYKAFTMRMDRM
eukprot:494107-Hanusia_phi.AAC.1